MANLNRVLLIGNITRDIDLKTTPKGTAVANVCLAINRVFTTERTGKTTEVTFVDVELWGHLAELASKHAYKGRLLYIEGRLKLETWDDKASGQKRSRLKVVAEELQLLGPPARADGQPPAPVAADQANDASEDYIGSDNAVTEDDIPL